MLLFSMIDDASYWFDVSASYWFLFFFSDEYMGTHQVVPDVSLFYELRLIYYMRPSKF